MRSLKALLLGAIVLAALAPLAPARAGVPGAPLCFQVIDDPTNDPFQNEQFFAVNGAPVNGFLTVDPADNPTGNLAGISGVIDLNQTPNLFIPDVSSTITQELTVEPCAAQTPAISDE